MKLELKDLSVAYGAHQVITDMSLTVTQGEILAVIGPNGAGKTTLIRVISGVVLPKSGEILADGREVTGLTIQERARILAVVPQARNLPGEFSVYQAVLMGRTPHLDWFGNISEEDHHFTRLALQQCQLDELIDRPVGELSGGEQQRVLVARALAQDTPILLLDEPTTHLDIRYQTNLLNLVRELTFDRQLTVLMVLHDLNQAGLYADRVALLEKGQVFVIGEPQHVLTVENLEQVYKIHVSVIVHPEFGTPLVIPDVQQGRGSRKTLPMR